MGREVVGEPFEEGSALSGEGGGVGEVVREEQAEVALY